MLSEIMSEGERGLVLGEGGEGDQINYMEVPDKGPRLKYIHLPQFMHI